MKKFIKIAAFTSAAALTLIAAQSQAVSGIWFDLGSTSTLQNPQAFNCTVTGGNNTDQVNMINRAVMVTGFQAHGVLNTTVAQLNSVYFNSYHDPKYPNQDGHVAVLVPNGNVTCQDGQGTGRTLIPGNYGVATP